MPHRVDRLDGGDSVAPEWVDIVMPVSSPPPFLVEQNEHVRTPHAVRHAGVARHHSVPQERLARPHDQLGPGSARIACDLDIELARTPYGYLVLYDSRGLVLRLRRPPHISPSRPLEGLTITVDPGHPPGGAIGPTG